MGTDIDPARVAIYIRWSTDDQASGTTLQVQHDSCRHYVLSQGWQYSPELVFVDDGYSGGSLLRPAMTRLRAQVEAGEIGCVVVLRIDRLSRNIVDAVQLVLHEWAGRCHLKSVTEPIDTTTELGRMIFGLLAMFADFERATIRERTRSGKLRRIAEGQQMHAAPAFGYRRRPGVRGQWVEDPDEAPVVRQMFQWAASGVSVHAVVRRLNEAGLRTRRGKPWTVRAVSWILRNKTYMGVVEFGRAARPDRGAPPSRDAQPQVRVETRAAPRLVTEDLFRQVQELLDARAVQRRRLGSRALGSPHLLVGLAACTCGSAVVYKGVPRRGDGSARGYYLCPAARRGACHQRGYIPAESVELVVEHYFLNLYDLSSVAADLARPRLEALAGERAALEAGLRRAEGRRLKARRAARRVLDAALQGRVPLDDLAALRSHLSEDRADVEDEIAALKAELAALEAEERSLRAHPVSLADVWRTLPAPDKRELLQTALRGRIIVSRAKGSREVRIQATWRVQTRAPRSRRGGGGVPAGPQARPRWRSPSAGRDPRDEG